MFKVSSFKYKNVLTPEFCVDREHVCLSIDLPSYRSWKKYTLSICKFLSYENNNDRSVSSCVVDYPYRAMRILPERNYTVSEYLKSHSVSADSVDSISAQCNVSRDQSINMIGATNRLLLDLSIAFNDNNEVVIASLLAYDPMGIIKTNELFKRHGVFPIYITSPRGEYYYSRLIQPVKFVRTRAC